MDFLARDVLPDFDAGLFYNLQSLPSSNLSLSAGYQWTNGSVSMAGYGSLSSKNWQLYYEVGRYFIRNYDFPTLQLGLNKSLPVLRERSGSFGQQWNITKDGTGWLITNGLLGDGMFLALTANDNTPAMLSSKEGATWVISSNPR